MTAFYNEVDPYASEWLSNLVRANAVAAGRVDARSIRELRPHDVADAVQAHFFAGIGVWSYALRLAGWPDDAPVWTGSAPCQPFSQAGRKLGVDDERHLWPVWFELIRACRPSCIFLEQVASPPGRAWLDLVLADLEGSGYAWRATDLAAACSGAPHKRQRLFVVAVSSGQRLEELRVRLRQRRPDEGLLEAPRSCAADVVVDADRERWREGARANADEPRWPWWGRVGAESFGGRSIEPRRLREAGQLGDAESRQRWNGQREESARSEESAGGSGVPRIVGNAGGNGGGWNDRALHRAEGDRPGEWRLDRALADELVPAGATRGAWSDAEWIVCRDGKIRPAQPGAAVLVDGPPSYVALDGSISTPSRTKMLRGFGNALVAPVAAVFIRAVLETLTRG